jgi:phosphate transport system substrate-binding protein
VVVGSSSVFPFASTVAERFGRDGRWRTPLVESIGTGAGIARFCAGVGPRTPDVAEASRPMTLEEQRGCAARGVDSVVALRLGTDGIVILQSRVGRSLDVTRTQLYRAVARSLPIAGRFVPNPYRRWIELDPALPNRPIRVYGPAPNHGTRDAFAALALLPVCERLAEARVLPERERLRACQAVREDGAWIDVAGDYGSVVGRLLADPDAVAVLPYSFLESNRERLRAAAIDGIEASAQSIADWRYPLVRPLFVYVKCAHVGRVPGLAEFVLEFVSERAAGHEGYLVERGLAPLPKPYLDYERRKAEALAAESR